MGDQPGSGPSAQLPGEFWQGVAYGIQSRRPIWEECSAEHGEMWLWVKNRVTPNWVALVNGNSAALVVRF